VSGQTAIASANGGGSVAPRERPLQARERLLRAALVRFEADGTLGPTLEAIRREAGVSVGALYHHFPDKQALAEALFVELMERFQEGLLKELRSHAGAEEGVKAGVRYYLRWVSSNRAAASFVLAGRAQDPRLRERNRRFLSEVMAWWQTHVHYGAVRALPLDVIHALWLGPAAEYSRHWVAGRAKRVPSSVAQLLADAAWQTLKEQT
jgi:AcrR family transcriptional regulator